MLPAMECATKDYTVYVVDDDMDVRSSISFLLDAGGQSSTLFETGIAFLERLPDLEPGCILLDVRMPGLDGVAVLTEMNRRKIRWPVVMMTGHGDTELAVETMKLGAVEYIEKPFSKTELQDSLGRARLLLGDGSDL